MWDHHNESHSEHEHVFRKNGSVASSMQHLHWRPTRIPFSFSTEFWIVNNFSNSKCVPIIVFIHPIYKLFLVNVVCLASMSLTI